MKNLWRFAVFLGLAGCSQTQNEAPTGAFATPRDAGVEVDALPPLRPPGPGVVINEVSPEADYVELLNTGQAVDLAGWSLVDGGWNPDDPDSHRAPLAQVLAPGERLWVETLPFGLGAEDVVRLLDARGDEVDVLAWGPEEPGPLCRLPDGVGPVQACRPTPDAPNLGPEVSLCGNGQVDAGEACDGAELGGQRCEDRGEVGSLGCAADCSTLDFSGCEAPVRPVVHLVINEVSAADDDAIELLNLGDSPVDLGGYAVADAHYDPTDPDTEASRYPLAAGRVVAPGAYLVLRRGTDHSFGLGREDAVRLLDDRGTVLDDVAWPADQAAVSWCRLPDGTGPFQACATATFGAPNRAAMPRCGDQHLDAGEVCDGPDLGGMDCARLGFDGGMLGCAEDCQAYSVALCTAAERVVLNEVSSSDDDAIELHNAGRLPVDLTGWSVADADFDPEDPEATADHRHILAGEPLTPGAYRVLVRDVDHPFGLGRADSLTLRNRAGEVVDATVWDTDEAAVAWCRLPDGVGPFQVCAVATRGGPNLP